MTMKWLLTMALLAPVPALAQTAGSADRSPSDAAQAFSLDMKTLPADDKVAGDTAKPADAAASSVYSLDTPIAMLIADPRAKAVLDENLPGLTDDANIDKFRTLSLRGFQPLTGGQLTDALLAKTGRGLAAIKEPLPQPVIDKPVRGKSRAGDGR